MDDSERTVVTEARRAEASNAVRNVMNRVPHRVENALASQNGGGRRVSQGREEQMNVGSQRTDTASMSGWGLLSVADVLHQGEERNEGGNEKEARESTEPPAGEQCTDTELYLPWTECSSDKLVPFTTRTVARMAKRTKLRPSTLEDLFLTREAALRRSLEASEAIHDKLNNVMSTIAASVEEDAQALSLLRTVVSLCSVLMSDHSGLLEAFVRGMEMVDWKSASRAECLDILDAFKQAFDFSALSPIQQNIFLSAEMSLALYSGKLSAVTDCLLAQNATATLEPFFLPPSNDIVSTTVDTTTEAFLTRMLWLPPSWNLDVNGGSELNFAKQAPVIYNFGVVNGLWVVTASSGRVVFFSAQGLMETRANVVRELDFNENCQEKFGFLHRNPINKEEDPVAPRNPVAILCENKTSFIIVVPHEDTFQDHLRMTRNAPAPPGGALASVSTQVSTTKTAAFYFYRVLFLPHDDALSSHPNTRPSSAESIKHPVPVLEATAELHIRGSNEKGGKSKHISFSLGAEKRETLHVAVGVDGVHASHGNHSIFSVDVNALFSSSNKPYFVGEMDDPEQDSGDLGSHLPACENSRGPTVRAEEFLGPSRKNALRLFRVPRQWLNQKKCLNFTKDLSVVIGRFTIKNAFEPFTIECWVNPSSCNEQLTVLSIGDKSTDEVFVGLAPGANGSSVIWQGGARTPQLGSSSVSCEKTGKASIMHRWWHVGLVFTGSAWELWIDGELAAGNDAIVSPLPIVNAGCVIGKLFVGLIAEVRVWGYRRSAAQFRRDRRRSLTGSENGLIGYFPLDEQQGTVIADYSQNCSHALLSKASASRHWSEVDCIPIAKPITPRWIDDFVPLAMHSKDIHLPMVVASTTNSHAVAVGRIISSSGGGSGEEVQGVSVFEYSADTGALVSQTDVTLPAYTVFRHVAYHDERKSLLLFATHRDSGTRLLMWELHQQSHFPLVPFRPYPSVWLCGKALLKSCAEYAQRIMGAEKCLLDQGTWTARIPSLIADSSEGVIANLLLVAKRALLEKEDRETASNVAALIGANLTLHTIRNGTDYARRELGELFPDCFAMIAEAAWQDNHIDTAAVPSVQSPRLLMLWLAFHPMMRDTVLLQLCVTHLVDDGAHVRFLSSRHGQRRTSTNEDLVFAAIVAQWMSLQRVYSIIRPKTSSGDSGQYAKVSLITAPLIGEASYFVGKLIRLDSNLTLGDSDGHQREKGDLHPLRSTREEMAAAARKATLALEVFQEILFAVISKAVKPAKETSAVKRIGEKDGSGGREAGGTGASAVSKETQSPISAEDAVHKAVEEYSVLLLKVCDRHLNLVVSMLRRENARSSVPQDGQGAQLALSSPHAPSSNGSAHEDQGIPVHSRVEQYLKDTLVGSLLPSLITMIPMLSSSMLSSLTTPIISCRDALVALVKTLPVDVPWIAELTTSMTFAVGRIACSVTLATDVVVPPLQEGLEYLFRGGLRRTDSERDVAIKNLQQGVGPLAKIFADLGKESVSLRVVKDERILSIERYLFAAYCSALIHTDVLLHPSKNDLRSVFDSVRKLRVWLLSQKQENPLNLDEIEKRALFLGRFEPCSASWDEEAKLCLGGSNRSGQRGGREKHTSSLSETKQWRRMFKSWKALRNLKAMVMLLSSSKALTATDTGALLSNFLQDKSVNCDEIEAQIVNRTKKAQSRLRGLSLLRQLITEASISDTQRRLIYPVMVKTFSGWHYSDGIEGCAGDILFRIRAAFFDLLDTVILHFHQLSGKRAVRHLCGELILSMLNTPWKSSDFDAMSPNITRTLRSMWSLENREILGTPPLNGDIPRTVRKTKLTHASAAPTAIIGSSGLTVRSVGERSACVGSCKWTSDILSRRRRNRGSATFVYYYEVHIIDAESACSCSVGVAQPGFNASKTLGSDPGTFALQVDDGILLSESSVGNVTGMAAVPGDTIGCGWSLSDSETSSIFWTHNGRRLPAAVVHVSQFSELVPVVSVQGKGTISVNFGNDSFVYLDLPPKLDNGQRKLGDEAWDVFRVYSLRAVTSFIERTDTDAELNPATTVVKSQPESPHSPKPSSKSSALIVVVQCLESIAQEIERTLHIASAEAYLTTLGSHVLTLSKLLFNGEAPPLREHARSLGNALRLAVDYLLFSHSRCSPQLRIVFLTAWVLYMHQLPPESVESSARLRLRFIPTVLSMCLVEYNDSSVDALSAVHPQSWNDGVSWAAVALLQFINCNPRHSWSGVVHEWIMHHLGTTTDEGLLALHILEGAPRLIVPGDTIALPQTKDAPLHVVLLSYSLGDEICTVLTQRKEKHTLSLKNVPFMYESEGKTFPIGTSDLHQKQVQQLFNIAVREWRNGSGQRLMLRHTLRQMVFTARLCRSVLRCVVSGHDLPTEVLSSLSLFTALADVAEDLVVPREILLMCLLVPCRLLTSGDECDAGVQMSKSEFNARGGGMRFRENTSDPTSVNFGTRGSGGSEVWLLGRNQQSSVSGLLDPTGNSQLLQGVLTQAMSSGNGSDARQEIVLNDARGLSGSQSNATGTRDSHQRPQGSNMERSSGSITLARNDQPLHSRPDDQPTWDPSPSPVRRSQLQRDEYSTGRDHRHHHNQQRQPHGPPGREEAPSSTVHRENPHSPSQRGPQGAQGSDLHAFFNVNPNSRDGILQTLENRRGGGGSEHSSYEEDDDEDGSETSSMTSTTESDGSDDAEDSTGADDVAMNALLDGVNVIDDDEEDEEDEYENEGCNVSTPYHGIRLVNGAISVSGAMPVGSCFTVDLHLRPESLMEEQYVLYQPSDPTSFSSPTPSLILKIISGKIIFGWAPLSSHQPPQRGDLGGFGEADLSDCRPRQWLHLTIVQRGNAVEMYVNASSRCKTALTECGVLLQSELFIGGIPNHRVRNFKGDIREVRIIDSALSNEMIVNLDAELGGALEDSTELVTVFRCERLRVETARRVGRGCVPLTVTTVGEVVWLQPSHLTGTLRPALQAEVDFATEGDDGGLFTVRAGIREDTACSVWHHVLTLSQDELVRELNTVERYSLCSTAANVLLRSIPTVTDKELRGLSDEHIRRIVHLSVGERGPELFSLLGSALEHFIRAGRAARFVTEAVNELLQITQRTRRSLQFESPHPCKSLNEPLREVCVPDQEEYEVYFDQRCASSNLLIMFYADSNRSNVIAQTPGFATSPLRILARKFYFDVRLDSLVEQWGYRMVVVHSQGKQLAAVRLLRRLLTTTIMTRGNRFPTIFTTKATVEQLATATVTCNGKARRVLLSCLTDLLLNADVFRDDPPNLSQLHELRRIAERQYRRNAAMHLQCRFVQVVSEFFVAMRAAELVWSTGSQALALTESSTSEGHLSEAERFSHLRSKQQQLYKQRFVGERVHVEKHLLPTSLQVEVISDQTFMVWSEQAGSSLIALAAVTKGRWYYEVKMAATGDVFLGVVPMERWEARPSTWSSFSPEGSMCVFNGKTGQLAETGDDSNDDDDDEDARRIWRPKDTVGVVIDGDACTLSFYVNGVPSDMVISFAHVVSDSYAASAAGVIGSNRYRGKEVEVYPYFVMGAREGISINFGSTYFDFDVPQGCLPVDPTNLSLGTLVPYNHIRAFWDITAYMFGGEDSSPPPFIREDMDPFEKKTERQGPSHVTLEVDEGITVNQLTARNTGTRFCSTYATCTVTGGKWYYEVTLLSQGLMQIGWASADHRHEGSVGDTPTSWAVDLFRRCKWHNGRSEQLTMVRRWTYGDVIGCAIDLDSRCMSFTCNGRNIRDSVLGDHLFQSLPTGLHYCPAVSLRSGNGLQFNFGSTAFKFKPDGFTALGVPDSWNERVDTYYAGMGPATTLRSLQRVRDNRLLLEQRFASGISLLEPAAKFVDAVRRVDKYCSERGRTYLDITEDNIRDVYADGPNTRGAWDAFTALVAFARVVQTALPFLSINISHRTATTTFLMASQTIIFSSVREALRSAMLKETNCRSERFRIVINRARARHEPRTVSSSVFGQTFELIADQHPRLFKTSKRFWSVSFAGEGAEDVGGPYREHLSEMCQELMSASLPLFVPTANNTHNVGTYRDAMVPAASATSPQHLAMFVFIGQIMGGAMRSGEPLNLFFPPLFWKSLSGFPLVESDLDDVDRICLQCVREFRNMKQTITREVFEDTFDSEVFITRLSDGSTKELVDSGSSVRVTFDNCEEYAARLAAARIGEFHEQIAKLREGLLSVVPEQVIALLTASELEEKVCGKPDYTVDELKSSATFEGVSSEDRRVQFLWQALNDATPQQRALFLRFVSGRERMPVKLRVIPIVAQSDPDTLLPRAATCFYAIELPDYSTLEIMKDKLYYTIENCLDIDTDFHARDAGDGAPQLLVGVEDGRPDEIDSVSLDGEP